MTTITILTDDQLSAMLDAWRILSTVELDANRDPVTEVNGRPVDDWLNDIEAAYWRLKEGDRVTH